MHKLRHPIAMFMVTVLVVIGIGVGVVAATTSQRVYGPPGARFTVTFPGRVSEQYMKLPAPDIGVGYNSNGPYTGRPPTQSSIIDSVSAQYLSNGISMHGLRALVLSFKSAAGLSLARLMTETTEQVNGFRFTRLGPACEQTLCLEILIVVHDRAIWILSSTATGGYLATWRNLFDSFQPIA